MWEAIKWAIQKGLRGFNFGRTDMDHEGLAQFKRGWSPRENKLHYYRYDLERNSFISNQAPQKTSYRFLSNAPIPLLKTIGALCYRHIG